LFGCLQRSPELEEHRNGEADQDGGEGDENPNG
jgi:hypothetical protein